MLLPYLKILKPLLFRQISTNGPQKWPVRSPLQVVFGKYLFWTNTISSGVLMFVGDLLQQEISRSLQPHNKGQNYDYQRLTRMFITGLCMGPVHHYYYKFINSVWPKRELGHVTKKILADQFIMSPICIAQFFYTVGLLEMKSVKQCSTELQGKFLPVYTMDWCVWPPTQFLNFYLVPVKYQVIYINAVTTLYNVFLSYIKHRDMGDKTVPALMAK